MNETMKDGERTAFEAAWAAQYPDHGKCAFVRSGIDSERYATTRVQDGWLMWQARAASPQSGEPVKPQATLVTFDEFLQYGIDHGANIVNGMPWSFMFNGHAVTHENDDLYLIGTPSIQFRRGEVLVATAFGHSRLIQVLQPQAPTERMSLSDDHRAVILEASRSLAVRADELKASNTSMDGTWCDAEEQAQYEAEVRLIERLQDVYNAAPTERMSDAEDAAPLALATGRRLDDIGDFYATPRKSDEPDAPYRERIQSTKTAFEAWLRKKDAARKAEIERREGQS